MEKLNLFVLTHRRFLIALSAGIAAWAVVAALSQTPDYVRVPVAARDLSSGSTISSGDIRVAEFAAGSVPDHVLRRSDITARIVAGPMRQGEPFTDQRAILAHRLASGEQLALIDVSASSARLLRVGDIVDVVALDPDGGKNSTIASAAAIISLDASTDSNTASIGVAVKAKVAHKIMNAQLHSPIVVLPAGVA